MYKEGRFSKQGQRQSQQQVTAAAAAATEWLSVHE
jgi:hypothetical protein